MDDEEITLPEFDEKKFMEKERRKAKTSFISFLFGVLIGIICRFLWTNLDSSIRWPLCFLLAVASIGFMARILQFLKIDIKQFSKKEWAGSIAFYLFTWLAIFILAINPPFYDASPPKIEAIALPEIQEENGSILVVAHVTDNSGVKKVTINISGNEYEMEKDEEIPVIYTYVYEGENAEYEIKAIDKKGKKEKYNGLLKYSQEVIKVDIPDKKLNSSDEIEIRVYKNISEEKFRVYYKINGEEVNATESGEIGDYLIFTISPKYKGWKENEENEVEIYVEVIYYFPGIYKKYSNLIYGGKYFIETVADENIGKEPSPKIEDLPEYHDLRTPGFEFIALVMAFIILVIGRNKRSRKKQ